MMRTLARAAAIPTVAALLAACATADRVPPPGAAGLDYRPMTYLVETPTSRMEHDIPESQRIKWYEAQRPPAAVAYRPVQVEREYVVRHEYEPVRYVERSRAWDGWYLPFALSLGWWGGHRHGHRGWGWGVNYNLGRPWGWGW